MRIYQDYTQRKIDKKVTLEKEVVNLEEKFTIVQKYFTRLEGEETFEHVPFTKEFLDAEKIRLNNLIKDIDLLLSDMGKM